MKKMQYIFIINNNTSRHDFNKTSAYFEKFSSENDELSLSE